jgi:hypothetical protein
MLRPFAWKAAHIGLNEAVERDSFNYLDSPLEEGPRLSFTAHDISSPYLIFKGSLVDPLVRASNDINDPSKLARYLSGMGAD